MFGADTVPAAVSYTDHDTVLAVQSALKQRGFDPGPLDGIFGPKTSAAIKSAQKSAGKGASGIVDYGVLAMLGVKAPAYTPTVTTAGRSASAAAKDADAAASVAQTPSAVYQAAQTVQAANAVAIPALPPEVQTQVAQAVAAANAAKTPDEVAQAAQQIQVAAKAVVAATSWWNQPLWQNAPVKRWHVTGGLGVSMILAGVFMTMRKR